MISFGPRPGALKNRTRVPKLTPAGPIPQPEPPKLCRNYGHPALLLTWTLCFGVSKAFFSIRSCERALFSAPMVSNSVYARKYSVLECQP